MGKALCLYSYYSIQVTHIVIPHIYIGQPGTRPGQMGWLNSPWHDQDLKDLRIILKWATSLNSALDHSATPSPPYETIDSLSASHPKFQI